MLSSQSVEAAISFILSDWKKIAQIIAPKQSISLEKLTEFCTQVWKVVIQFSTTGIDNTMLQTSVNIFAQVHSIFWIQLKQFDFITLRVIDFLDKTTSISSPFKSDERELKLDELEDELELETELKLELELNESDHNQPDLPE